MFRSDVTMGQCVRLFARVLKNAFRFGAKRDLNPSGSFSWARLLSNSLRISPSGRSKAVPPRTPRFAYQAQEEMFGLNRRPPHPARLYTGRRRASAAPARRNART